MESTQRLPDAIHPDGSTSASKSNARTVLNSTGCYVQHIEGKGRGVFASRDIPSHTDIEISPVLLFTSFEYEEHGKHTLLDHYTFNWRDGRMALALGLGSLFNHSQTPNVMYKLEPEAESIRYTTCRDIAAHEELCIFYGHKLWFQPADVQDAAVVEDMLDDEWGGLSGLQSDGEDGADEGPFVDGNPEEFIAEDELPFTRIKLIDDEAEDELSAVQTEPAWVVDITEPKHTATMLKWLKQAGYDTPSLSHLKRIRKIGSVTTLLLSTVSLTPMAPQIPAEFGSPTPYALQVPRSAALTTIALQHKTTFWPVVYAPRKKYEPEPWSRARARWAWEAMRTVVQEAKAAKAHGELPIVALVPVPYDEETRETTQVTEAIIAHDTRVSASHPLRHVVLNLVRSVADQRAKIPAPSVTSKEQETELSPSQADPESSARNGTHYLLTDLTLFISHEPCIMCSMALLHSRVKEVFYLIPMEKTGGCGGVACLSRLLGVNHRYTIGRWKKGASGWKSEDLNIGEDVDA